MSVFRKGKRLVFTEPQYVLKLSISNRVLLSRCLRVRVRISIKQKQKQRWDSALKKKKKVTFICMVGLSPNMTLLANGLECLFLLWCFQKMGWALGGWKTAFNYLLLWVTHACLREHIGRIPFWQKEIILRPPKTE